MIKIPESRKASFTKSNLQNKVNYDAFKLDTVVDLPEREPAAISLNKISLLLGGTLLTGTKFVKKERLGTLVTEINKDRYYKLLTHLYYTDATFKCDYPDKTVVDRLEEISDLSSYYSKSIHKLRKNYPDFLELLNDNYCYLGKTYEYVPQGVCTIGDNVLVSLYDSDDEKKSKVILITPDGKQKDIYLDMPVGTHVGGITYDEEHNLVWISNAGGKVSAFDYNELINSDEAKPKFTYQANVKNEKGENVASYITYYNGSLFVGSFNKSSNGEVIEYKIGPDGNVVGNGKKFTVPSKTQGISFYKKDGRTYMAISRSYGRTSDSKLELYDYNNGNPSLINKYTLPPMLEQVSFDEKGDLTVIFENNADEYRKSPGTVQIPAICQLRVFPFGDIIV